MARGGDVHRFLCFPKVRRSFPLGELRSRLNASDKLYLGIIVERGSEMSRGFIQENDGRCAIEKSLDEGVHPTRL